MDCFHLQLLVGLLETFAPDEVDQRLKSGRLLDSLPVEELEQLVRQHIGYQLHLAQSLLKDSQSAKNLQHNRDQLDKLRSQYESLHEENPRLVSQVASLDTERNILLNQVAALQSAAPAYSEKSSKLEEVKPTVQKMNDKPPEPDWMIGWRQAETFDRDSRILIMIGKTGLSRRPVIEAQAADMFGIKKAGRTRPNGILAAHWRKPWYERVRPPVRTPRLPGAYFAQPAGCRCIARGRLPGQPNPARCEPSGWQPVQTRPGIDR